jgi:hypothetical protein
MPQMLGGMVRKTSALALLALVTAIGLLTSDAAPAGATTCPDIDVLPDQ